VEDDEETEDESFCEEPQILINALLDVARFRK